MDHEELQDLCAGHALGILDAPEAARLADHLRRGCDACESEISAHRRTVGALGLLAGERRPAAAAEAALLARIAAPGRAPAAAAGVLPRPAAWSAGPLFRWALPAAALVVAGVSLWFAVDARRISTALVRENLTLHRLVDRTAHVVAMNIAGVDGFAASGLVLLDPGDGASPDDDRCSLHIGRLPPPPEGRTYQGWAVIDGRLHDLGTFEPDESGFGYTSHALASVDRVALVQVTVEPPGGVASPTGPAVLRARRDPP